MGAVAKVVLVLSLTVLALTMAVVGESGVLHNACPSSVGVGPGPASYVRRQIRRASEAPGQPADWPLMTGDKEWASFTRTDFSNALLGRIELFPIILFFPLIAPIRSRFKKEL